MSKNIDTNINNYSKEEILEILGLSKNETDIDLIQNKFNDVIKKFKAEDNSRLVKFFKEAKSFLLVNSEEEEGEKEEEVEAHMWLREQFLKQKNITQIKKGGQRERNVGFFENTSVPVMLRNNLQINNTIPLDVAQGNLNPTFKQKIVRTVIINSAFRNNTIPFKKNESSATNFTCTLSVPLRKVLKMTLNSVFIPTTFNVFDDNISNTVFWIKKDVQASKKIKIQNGTYNIYQLKNELQRAIDNEFPTDDSYPRINVQVSDNKKLRFTSNNNDYEFNFLPPLDGYELPDGYDCNGSNINYNNCLGNYLGFRLLSQEISGLEQEIPGKMPTIFKKKLEHDINNNSEASLEASLQASLEAEVKPNLNGSNYFNLIIDDFNNNHPTNRLVTIGNNDDRLTLPTYYNKIVNNADNPSSVDCDSDDKIKRVLPSNPRVLTQNQLFSINNILENRAIKTNRFNESNSSNNVLATIQLPDIFESIATNNEADSKQLKSVISISNFDSDMVERSYFGPVLIQRLRVSLVDYLGNLVNLNGHNWSFTLKVEELYEY